MGLRCLVYDWLSFLIEEDATPTTAAVLIRSENSFISHSPLRLVFRQPRCGRIYCSRDQGIFPRISRKIDSCPPFFVSGLIVTYDVA